MMQQPDGKSFGASAPENYQRYFVPAIGRPVARGLLRAADLQAGERVLDVGCGTGVVTRLAAEQVGREGHVAGLDVSPAMIAVARSSTPTELNIEWHEASAEAMPLPDDAFDVVLCQMSLQFIPDKPAALREMRRVLTAKGRAVVNVPGPAGPLFEILADAMARHVAPQAARFVQAVFALHDESELESLLREAGFHDVDTHAETGELSLPAPRDFLWQYVSSTPLAAALTDAPPDARAALEREVLVRWKEFETGDGMACPQRLVTGCARN